MRSCNSCKYSFTDYSLNYSECTNDSPDWTDEEVVKYYENGEDNCPYYVELKDPDYVVAPELHEALMDLYGDILEGDEDD